MASPFKRRSSQTAKRATGSRWTGSCAKLRAPRRATLSPSRSRPRQRNRNPKCRQTCERPSRPPPQKRGRYGRTLRPSRAEIGSTGDGAGLGCAHRPTPRRAPDRPHELFERGGAGRSKGRTGGDLGKLGQHDATLVQTQASHRQQF
jgi:hypothetical protein